MKETMKIKKRAGEEGFYSYEPLHAMRPSLGPYLPISNSVHPTFLKGVLLNFSITKSTNCMSIMIHFTLQKMTLLLLHPNLLLYVP